MGTKEPRDRTKYRMSRVGQKDTDLERSVRSRLHREGLRFRKHVKALPGVPDIVFSRARLAVFIDGDFWHGFELPRWRHSLSQYWIDKITRTMRRDRRNFAQLRRTGWKVQRVWGHDVQKNLDGVVDRIKAALV